VGIIFLLHDTTVLYTISLTTAAAISAQNNFQGLILGGYIYRYTPRRYAPGWQPSRLALRTCLATAISSKSHNFLLNSNKSDDDTSLEELDLLCACMYASWNAQRHGRRGRQIRRSPPLVPPLSHTLQLSAFLSPQSHLRPLLVCAWSIGCMSVYSDHCNINHGG